MTSDEIRKTYLDFFKSKGHKEITPSPLVLKDDPTTLFTSAGMQQLVPYLSGNPHSKGTRLVNSQPIFRAVDIEEVGDNRHTTFFEMLGNWSLGDYFKKEEIPWLWEFLTEELGVPKDKLFIGVFEGSRGVSKDEESEALWKSLGIPDEKIFFYGVKENWWSTSGVPEEMREGDIGGPDTEVFYQFDSVEHNPKYGKICHPNCQCGKFLEIANSVFIQYRKKKDGTLEELPQKNVDFGGGLERISAAVNDKADIFQIDLFTSLIGDIEKETGAGYGATEHKDKSIRIVADHVRAAINLLAEGVATSNKLQGYVVRRLIRRSMFRLHLLGAGIGGGGIAHIGETLGKDYPKVAENWDFINKQLLEEGKKFADALKRGLGKLRVAVEKGEEIDGRFVFDLYQSEGFPMELTLEVLKENGIDFNLDQKKSFREEFEKHKELSKAASSKVFKK